VRLAVNTLEVNKAVPFEDGFYLGKTNPHDKVKLLADTTWVNAKTYSDVKDLYKGEIGELYQVRFLLDHGGTGGNGVTDTGTGATSSSVTLYHPYIHGMDAFGTYDLDGDKPHLDIIADKVDAANPAGRFSLASWSGSFVAKILNSNWLVVVKSA